jgi:hypothetical protein
MYLGADIKTYIAPKIWPLLGFTKIKPTTKFSQSRSSFVQELNFGQNVNWLCFLFEKGGMP